MTEYTFFNFPAKARCEADRIALELAGCKYEEEYLSFDSWPEKKKQLVDDGISVYGQLPYLRHKDKYISQSMTILRYLGREHNMYGDNDDEKWQIDMLVDGAVDLRETLFKVHFTPEAEKVAAQKKFLEETIPTWIGYFDKLKQKNPGDHFVGKKLSIADIAIFDIITIIEDIHKNTITKNSTLKNFIDAFSAQPRYVKYRKSSRYHDLFTLI